MNFNDYVSAKDAAESIGITYQLLMSRIRKGKISAEKKGWAVFIHKDEVARAVIEQKKINASKKK